MAYATLAELKKRLDWTLDEDEERIGTAALEDAEVDVQHFGRPWTEEQLPRTVKSLLLRAVARYMRNPDGYVSSRAGDETLQWTDRRDERAGSFRFSADEVEIIRQHAGKASGGLHSVLVTAYETKLRTRPEGHVPTDRGDPFPLYLSETSPW